MIFLEIETVTPRLNDTERREVKPEGINCQINPGIETNNDTVKEELFETPVGGSTRSSVTTNINNKSRSTKIPAPNVGTQQKRHTEGEEFSNRRTASTSQNFTER